MGLNFLKKNFGATNDYKNTIWIFSHKGNNLTNIKFYNINDLHLKETDIDKDERYVVYKDNNLAILKDYLDGTIAFIISLNDKKYNSIDELPNKIRDIVLKEMV